jgi:hypothetical protein
MILMTRKQKRVYLEVTVKEIYAFNEGSINGWTDKQILADWFKHNRINLSHTTRDSHIPHRRLVGGSRRLREHEVEEIVTKTRGPAQATLAGRR